MGWDAIGGSLGLGTGRVAKQLAHLVTGAVEAPRAVLVLGDDALARALAAADLSVIVVRPSARRRRKAPLLVAASPTALPFSDGAVDAALCAGLPAGGLPALRELTRVVRTDGLVALATATSALVRRVAPADALAATLVHAGIVDVEQLSVGATLITWGRVRQFIDGV
jgi:SAM-dependent methyltransferase